MSAPSIIYAPQIGIEHYIRERQCAPPYDVLTLENAPKPHLRRLRAGNDERARYGGVIKCIMRMSTAEERQQDVDELEPWPFILMKDPERRDAKARPLEVLGESKSKGGSVPPVNRWLCDVDLGGDGASSTRKAGAAESKRGAKKAENSEIALRVRIYVLRATGLRPMQRDMLGWQKPFSNPFLKVSVDKPRGYEVPEAIAQTFKNEAENLKGALQNTTDPEFNKCFEIDCLLPSVSMLTVGVHHASQPSGSALIGETKIDLEDLWYSRSFKDHVGRQTVPYEPRTLYAPHSTLPQGRIEMRVELYDLKRALQVPPAIVGQPKPKFWELRLVIWQTNQVPKQGNKRSSDMFVRSEFSYREVDGNPGGAHFMETDYHHGCRNGRGLFHERMKFRVKIPCKTPRLTIQVKDGG